MLVTNAIRAGENLEPASLLIVQDRSENAGGIKVRVAVPVNGSVHAHESNRAHVADDSVIFDGLIRHRNVRLMIREVPFPPLTYCIVIVVAWAGLTGRSDPMSLAAVCQRCLTLNLREAAIHEQFRSRDVAAVFGREKHHRLGDLIGRAESAQRNSISNHLQALLAGFCGRQ